MKTLDPRSPVMVGNVWEDLVSDFLEMACFLSRGEQDFLLDALRGQVAAETIEAYPCFSIDGKIIVIAEQKPAGECWIYQPKQKKISTLK